jgi:peptide/nickel transport system ATP-binding protein
VAVVPDLDGPVRRMATIPGRVLDAGEMIAGCRFHPRCPVAGAESKLVPPPLGALATDQLVRYPPRLAAEPVRA